MINILNRKQVFYIGRGKHSPLGNPFSHLAKTPKEFLCKNREESIQKYRVWLHQKIKEKNKAITTELNKIYKAAKQGDVYLVCFCSPKPCHGQVIRELINEKLPPTEEERQSQVISVVAELEKGIPKWNVFEIVTDGSGMWEKDNLVIQEEGEYPNKRYWVACRLRDKKEAKDMILAAIKEDSCLANEE